MRITLCSTESYTYIVLLRRNASTKNGKRGYKIYRPQGIQKGFRGNALSHNSRRNVKLGDERQINEKADRGWRDATVTEMKNKEGVWKFVRSCFLVKSLINISLIVRRFDGGLSSLKLLIHFCNMKLSQASIQNSHTNEDNFSSKIYFERQSRNSRTYILLAFRREVYCTIKISN